MEKMEFFGACMPVCGITPATFADTLIDYYHAIHANLPSVAGQLGATYAVPILYVPLLMITHMVALHWLLRQPLQATA